MTSRTGWETYLLAHGWSIMEDTATHPSRAMPALSRQARAPASRHTSEDDLLTDIRRLAKVHGWLTYHTHDSRKSEEGFPDLVLAKPGRLIFAELKNNTRKLTPAQHTWLDVVAHTVPGVEAYLWRPRGWDCIVECLTRRADP
jgi:hypothetical protein